MIGVAFASAAAACGLNVSSKPASASSSFVSPSWARIFVHARVLGAVAGVDELLDARDGLADAGLDFAAEGEAEILDGLAIERVGEGDEDRVFRRADG